MSETKHTPGPWNICEDVNSEGLTGDLICTLNDDERDVGESEANARLVAAAPDMLEALKAEELAKSLHRAAALDDDPQKMKKVAILYAKSNRLRRAALAKAGAASSLDYTLTEIEIDQESYVVSPEPRGMALSLNNGFDTVEEALSNDNGADFPTSYGVCSVFMRAGGSPLSVCDRQDRLRRAQAFHRLGYGSRWRSADHAMRGRMRPRRHHQRLDPVLQLLVGRPCR